MIQLYFPTYKYEVLIPGRLLVGNTFKFYFFKIACQCYYTLSQIHYDS